MDKLVTFDGTTPGNNNMSDMLMFSLRGSGGKSGTNIVAAKGLAQMFDFKYGRINLHDLRIYGDIVDRKTLFCESGRVLREEGNGNVQGDMFITQSVVENVEFYYFNRVWKASHIIDTQFKDVGFMAMVGENPVTFEVPLRQEDNVNNLIFTRCHWEQGNNTTFFKAVGGAPSESLTHSIFAFFGCHFETRYWNTTILDLTNVYSIGFYNCQFTQNNNQGAEFAGLTEADIKPMFKLTNITGIKFDNCLISRIGVKTPANIANKMFELGGRIKGMRIDGGYMESATNNVNHSTDILWQSSATTPYRDTGDPWALFSHVAFNDPAVPEIHSDKRTWVSAVNRNEKWGSKFSSAKDLEFGFTNNTAANFDWTTAALQLTEQGQIRAKAFAGPKQTVASNVIVKFAVANKYNLNRRGFYLVYADHSVATYAMFFSDGTNAIKLFGSDNVEIGSAETSVASKLNVYLDSNKDVSVKNLFAYSVNAVLIHLA